MLQSLLASYSKNQIKILQHIRRQGKITRGSLVEVSGFKLLTVTKTVARFLEDGIIIEAGQENSTGGRKATLLSLNPHFRYVLSVDMGASGTRIGVVGMDGSIIEQQYIVKKTKIPALHVTIEELRELLQQLIEKYSRDKILGLGMGFSGTVRHKQGRVVFCPNLAGWNDVDVVKEFSEALGIPVRVDTVARCMALAEYTMGAGKGVNNQVAVSLGNSISAGIIMDGKIYRGADETAGEIGHICVSDEPVRCSCGAIGCLENFVSCHRVYTTVQCNLEATDKFSPLRSMIPAGATPSLSDIRDAAAQGDRICLDILDDCAKYISNAVGYLGNIVNPNMIILGGRLIDAFPSLVEEVSRAVKRKNSTAAQQKLIICQSALQREAAMIGGALMVIEELFHD